MGPFAALQALEPTAGLQLEQLGPDLELGSQLELAPHMKDELGWGKLHRWALEASIESAELWREDIEEDLCVFRQAPSQEGQRVLELDFMGSQINVPTAFELPGFYPQGGYQIHQDFSSGQRVWELRYALEPSQQVRLKALAPVGDERVPWEPALAAALCSNDSYKSDGLAENLVDITESSKLSTPEQSPKSESSVVHWSLNLEGAQLELSLGPKHLSLRWRALCEPLPQISATSPPTSSALVQTPAPAPAPAPAPEVRVLELHCQLQAP